jgi:hypothetical protein
MLAASRNERVNGRTNTLDDSINTRKGLSQSGAPSGRKWAAAALGLNINLEMISLSHKGRPRDRVITKWLDMLKQYGIRPIKFNIMIIINVDVTINERPLRE